MRKTILICDKCGCEKIEYVEDPKFDEWTDNRDLICYSDMAKQSKSISDRDWDKDMEEARKSDISYEASVCSHRGVFRRHVYLCETCQAKADKLIDTFMKEEN